MREKKTVKRKNNNSVKETVRQFLEKGREKLSETFKGNLPAVDWKRLLIRNLPYVIVFYLIDKVAWLYRYCMGASLIEKLGVLFLNFSLAFQNVFPSFHPQDLCVGVMGALLVKAVVYVRGKNAKKYRQGVEYGSARWGTPKDIAPFIDPVFEKEADIFFEKVSGSVALFLPVFGEELLAGSLRDHDDGVVLFLHTSGKVGEQGVGTVSFEGEGGFRNQTVVDVGVGQRGVGGDKSGIAAHDFDQSDAVVGAFGFAVGAGGEEAGGVYGGFEPE